MRSAILAGIAFLALAQGQSASLPAPHYPSPDDLAVSPDGGRLYAVCSQTDELAVIDLRTQSVAGRVPVGRVPRGIAVARDGARVYVTNSWSDTVSEIDAAALRVLRTFADRLRAHRRGVRTTAVFCMSPTGSATTFP